MTGVMDYYSILSRVRARARKKAFTEKPVTTHHPSLFRHAEGKACFEK